MYEQIYLLEVIVSYIYVVIRSIPGRIGNSCYQKRKIGKWQLSEALNHQQGKIANVPLIICGKSKSIFFKNNNNNFYYTPSCLQCFSFTNSLIYYSNGYWLPGITKNLKVSGSHVQIST